MFGVLIYQCGIPRSDIFRHSDTHLRPIDVTVAVFIAIAVVKGMDLGGYFGLSAWLAVVPAIKPRLPGYGPVI